VKAPGNNPGDDSGAAGGSNVRRKEVSAFNDFTVSDMMKDRWCVVVYAQRTRMELRQKA
jgi:hypothetical protein